MCYKMRCSTLLFGTPTDGFFFVVRIFVFLDIFYEDVVLFVFDIRNSLGRSLNFVVSVVGVLVFDQWGSLYTDLFSFF